MAQAAPVGYGALVDRHGLVVIPPNRWTFLAKQGVGRSEERRVALRLPHLDPTSMTDIDHLLFALKHEGVFLPVLDAYIEQVARQPLEDELSARISAQPTSQYARILWFLYEWLTDRRLPLADLDAGNYVPVLAPSSYFTGEARRVRRQRVFDNLLGSRTFCPVVRRTDELDGRSPAALREAMTKIIDRYDESVLSRALSFLYTKETLSSFAIERETPSPDRAHKFVGLLGRLNDVGPLDEQMLASLQAAIVDPRFAEPGYRSVQNYVGESLSLLRQRVHYVPPRPDALRELMAGWQESSAKLLSETSPVDPVIAAACVAYGFVYLHPFVDGNGRLHRFLVHHVLAHRKLTPAGFIVPVSAIMLSRRQEYDASLESFSRPLLGNGPGAPEAGTLDYTLDEEGSLTVTHDSRRHYRFIDMTVPATFLYRWLADAIEQELASELDFLVGLDRTRLAMRGVVDLPDRMVDLFVKLVLQNGGHISQIKRDSQFHRLTDEEISRLEAIVAEHMPRRAFDRSSL